MTETASDTSDTTCRVNGAATPARPTTDDRAAWKTYWQAQGMSWRTEPEIPADRQAYLVERRAIKPDIEQGVYPFKGVGPTLTRADIEWLLATHESQGVVGPVEWAREKTVPGNLMREGLDLRGADLTALDLRTLPLACMNAGLLLEEYPDATEDQMRAAAAELTGIDLRDALLEGATFRWAQLEDADLSRAQLMLADLRDAKLTGARLGAAQLEDADISRAQLTNADLRDANLKSARLELAHLEHVRLELAQMERAYLHGAKLTDAKLGSARLEDAHLEQAQLPNADLRWA